jgi:hypothetical protein
MLTPHKVLVRKLEGRRPTGKHRCNWEDSIKMGLKEIGWRYELHSSGSWRDQWKAHVNTGMNFRVP